MGKLNDVTIRGWIRSGERFAGRSDGEGFVLTWRKDTRSPFWKFRYRFAGKPRVMNQGSYSDLPLSAARQPIDLLRGPSACGRTDAHEAGRWPGTELSRNPRLRFHHPWFCRSRLLMPLVKYLRRY